MRLEARVTIDGHELTDEQAATLRVALSTFHRDLSVALRRKGGDVRLAQGAIGRCRAILNMMDDAKVG